MLRWLLMWLRKTVSDTHNAIVALIVVAVFGGGGLSAWLFQHQLPQLLDRNIPLWQTLLLACSVLLLFFIPLKVQEHIELRKPTEAPAEEFFLFRGFNWKARTLHGIFFGVEDVPYCSHHECSLVLSSSDRQWVCPEDGCRSVIDCSNLRRTREMAANIIKKQVRSREARTSK